MSDSTITGTEGGILVNEANKVAHSYIQLEKLGEGTYATVHKVGTLSNSILRNRDERGLL